MKSAFYTFDIPFFIHIGLFGSALILLTYTFINTLIENLCYIPTTTTLEINQTSMKPYLRCQQSIDYLNNPKTSVAKMFHDLVLPSRVEEWTIFIIAAYNGMSLRHCSASFSMTIVVFRNTTFKINFEGRKVARFCVNSDIKILFTINCTMNNFHTFSSRNSRLQTQLSNICTVTGC